MNFWTGRQGGVRRRGGWVVALLFFVACSGNGSADDESPPTTATVDPIAVTPVVDGSYRWQPLPVGAGGFVTGIVASPGPQPTFYARTDVGGAYRWDAANKTWHQLLRASNLPEVRPGDVLSVDSIAVAASQPTRVYLALGNDNNPGPDDEIAAAGRILVSDDGGETWRTATNRWFISGNQRYRTGSERISVDPADPDHVLFGSAREGLWQSRDGGSTWQQVPETAVPFGQFDDRTVDQVGVGTTAFVNGAMVAGVAGSAIYLSTDGGSTWASIRELEPGQYAAGAVEADGRLWVALNNSGSDPATLATYDPSTKQWTEPQLPFEAAFAVFAVDPADPKHVAVAAEAVRDDHFWTSQDGGLHWQQHTIHIESPQIPWLAATDLDSYMSTGRLLFDPSGDGSLWFAEGMAVWRTTDPDADDVAWVSRAQGIEETVASGIVAPPGVPPIGIVADRQGFRFDDPTRYAKRTLVDDQFVGGTSVDFSGGNPSVIAWVGAEYHIYYSADRKARGAISADGGATWTEFGGTTPAMFGGEIAVSATDPTTLVWLPTHFTDPWEFLRAPVGLYVSHDSGRTWEHQENVGGTDAFHRFLWWFNRRALAADRVSGNFYLMSDDSRFFTSTDGARTWVEAPNAPVCFEGNACHVLGQLQAQPGTAERLWASTGGDGLFRTDDAGRTAWQRVEGVQVVNAFGFGAAMQEGGLSTVYLYGKANADDQLGLYRSIDDGATWERISQYPADSYTDISAVTGDPDVPGRVYVAFSGTGFAQGDPVEANG